jgi:hypothetical protein
MRGVSPFKPRQRMPQHSQSFKWLEESWADKSLPWMRLAVVVLGKNDAEMEAAIAKLSFAEGEEGSLAMIFKRWREVRRDLDQMRDALDVALGRSLEALENVGRGPDDAS